MWHPLTRADSRVPFASESAKVPTFLKGLPCQVLIALWTVWKDEERNRDAPRDSNIAA